jgi:tyrosine decarboxylase/aspartate 1-decarboxylase
MVEFSQRGLSYYEVLERWIAFEKESGFDRFQKNLFAVEGPKLTSSPDIPWGDQVRHLVVEAYNRFMFFEDWVSTGVTKMHDEVISMVADILNLGSENAAGNVTTGGSESNFCAMFTAKSRALAIGKSKAGDSRSIVLPKTAHYSFFKACHLFDLTPIIVEPIPGTIYKINPEDMRRAIREDTIAIVATAGTWPFGTVEPIGEIGEIAEEKDLYFHIDACIGGFLLPFLERGGYKVEIPRWDFRVKGISSISADFHKNGMVPPPTSCIIYQNQELLNFAKKIAYPKGCLTGSRSAGPIAAAWTMLKLIGLEGYIAIAKKSMKLTETLLDGARQIGLKTVPDCKVNFTSIYSDEYDLMPVVEELRKKGWIFKTTTSFPPIGISVIVMPQNEGQIEAFIDDLKRNMKLAEPIKSKAEMKVYGLEYPMIY